MAAQPTDLSQIHSFQLQVYRSGNWIDVPITSAKGSVAKSRSGKIDIVIADRKDDAYRSRLYEGEKVRALRGLVGAPQVRCWTGYVDAPNISDQGGISRNLTITDNIKELNDAILLEGIVYDTWAPNKACADAIQKAINTQQYKPTNDAGASLTSTASYSSLNGNPVCYFPDLINNDGTLFTLASGDLGSFTSGLLPVASLMVPVASGASYSAFELTNRYLIASTMSMPGWTIASTSATALPPASGSVVVDFYNGIMYFSALDAGKVASFSSTYYSNPMWNYNAGAKVGDVVSEIMDKIGARWFVDGNGKFYSRYIDTTKAPKRILDRSEYINNGVQTNRDRRNVIVCEGWDGNCGTIIVSKGINWDDINNPPPKGLGKRQYLIMQDRTWNKQSAANNACYFAMQQLARRGKIMSAQIIDDPSLQIEDVLGFEGVFPEIGDGDFFYLESIDWEYSLRPGGGFVCTSNVTGTCLPGQGTTYLGPATGMTAFGSYDLTQDVFPMVTASLIPAGGSYYSQFSKATGLTLQYTPQSNGVENVEIFGSDLSYQGPFIASRTASGSALNVILPMASMTVGVTYAIKMRYMDQQGNLGIFRSFIQARA